MSIPSIKTSSQTDVVTTSSVAASIASSSTAESIDNHKNTGSTSALEKMFELGTGLKLQEKEKISFGLTNQNFRVSAEGKQYFVRLGSEHANSLYIYREREREFYQMGEKIGLAPKLIFFNSENGSLISDFIPNAKYFGKIMGKWSGDRNEVIKQIIQIMKQLHSCRAPNSATSGLKDSHDLVTHAIPYHRRALDHYFSLGTEIKADFSDKFVNAFNLSKDIQFPTETEVLCHHDWFWGNVLSDGKRLWLVDWEYADWDNPLSDLANFCVEHGLDCEERTLALAEYTPGFVEKQRQDLEVMYMLSSLRTAMWGMIQKKMWPDMPFNIDPIAQMHINDFWKVAETLPQSYFKLPIDLLDRYHA